MIILAYDGSLNGDWVSRYAMRLAANTGSTLSVLHVRDGSLGDDQLDVKLRRLELESLALGVRFIAEILPAAKDVFSTLLGHIPSGPEHVAVCGTRVRSRQRRFLSGTISEKLLRTGKFPVLAMRVVQPGLLGTPHDLLIPMTGQPRCFDELWPFLRLLLPGTERLFLLRCLEVRAMRLPYLSMARRDAMRRAGERYLSGIGEEILQRRGGSTFLLDWRIAICDDCVHEIQIQASRLKTHMVLMGATENLLGHRLLHESALERLLHETPCDVGIYRSL